MNTIPKTWLASGLAALLAGCFGGGGDDVAATVGKEMPASAAANSKAFISYLLPLSGSDEANDPLTIKDSFEVPADETGDPQILT